MALEATYFPMMLTDLQRNNCDGAHEGVTRDGWENCACGNRQAPTHGKLDTGQDQRKAQTFWLAMDADEIFNCRRGSR